MAVAREDEWFELAREPGQAMILVGSHFGPVRFLREQLLHLLKLTDLAVIGFLGSPLDRMEQEARIQGRVFERQQEQLKLRTYQYYVALQRLKEGGVVAIAADSGRGTHFVNTRFFGRQKKLGTGFANLAWETGALAVPFFVLQRDDGIREYRFHRPLSASRHGYDSFVTSMIEQYVDLLGEYWRAHPGNIRWSLAEHFLNLPIADTEMQPVGRVQVDKSQSQ
jgi:lauroyl/myristoyl acyltransferase